MINKALLYSLNYAYTNEGLCTLELPPSALPKRGIHIRLLRFIKGFITELFNFPFGSNKASNNKKIIIIYATQNQKKIALELAKNKDAFELISIMDGDNEKVNLLIPYIIGILSLPIVIWYWLTEKNNYRKRSYKYNIDQYMMTYGYIIFFYKLYKKMKPLGVVNSNDHSMINRVSAHVANRMQIKTIYLQHASVTKNFPPLSFDAVFLDGINALEKYSVEKQAERKINIYLSGSVTKKKLQGVRRKTIKTILLATNSLDQVTDISELIKCISKKNQYDVRLRIHPGDVKRKNEWKQVCQMHSIEFSDPTFDTLDKSFLNIDIMISGESNIVLDAALSGISSIIYSSNKSNVFSDYYGFIENKIAFRADGLNSILEILSSERVKEINYEGLKKYDAAAGSTNKNVVDQIIAEEIYRLVGINRGTPHYNFYDCWQKYSDNPKIWSIR